MLVFEKEGFLEVEYSHIEELYSSHATVLLEIPGSAPFPLRTMFCRHKVGASSACHVAFYCRSLKRALVFAAELAPGASAMESLTGLINNLGFQLEPVNLSLSPALRQVVLRDIAGLSTPTDALLQRSGREAMLADLEATISTEGSDSDAGKRATHTLKTERRLDEQAKLLRNVLEARLGNAEGTANALRELAEKAAALNTRLEQALALAAEERRQREHTDGIRIAAEKRLQELEAELVSAETRSAASLRQKKKTSQLDKRIMELQAQLAESVATLEAAQTQGVELADVNRRLQEEVSRLRGAVKNSMTRIESLERDLATTGETAAVATQAAEREILTLREKCHALEKNLAGVTASIEEERSARTRLVKAAAIDQQRIAELVAALDKLKKKSTTKPSSGNGADFAVERGQLDEALAAAQAIAQREHQARADVETKLEEAHDLINSLEQVIKQLQAKGIATTTFPASSSDGRQYAEETSGKLRVIEVQLDQERLEGKKLANALTVAERRIATLEAHLQKTLSQPAPETVHAQVDASAERKPLPHETRPAPRSGALFLPDWDLTGLPCRSPDQVLQAWSSVYNVQIALEGYPAQYSAAFLVVLKEGSQKRLYLLFDLKKDKHLLVCVPGKAPRDDAAFIQLVNDGQNYLKKSGFDLEKIAPADIPSCLKGYFSHP